jgi:hypothetical protein
MANGLPRSDYPYYENVNGCGGEGWSETAVRDTWGKVSFREACNNHDRCYMRVGSDLNACDDNFYKDVRASCERDSYVRDPIFNRKIPDPVTLSACYPIATTYYTAVRSVGWNWHQGAQAKAKRYRDLVQSYLASNPSSEARGRDVGLRDNLGDRVVSHREMREGSYLKSGDGRWMMVIQGDGNLVIYGPRGAIWASNTDGRGVPQFMLAMQSDGNLVIYGKNGATWASNTNGRGRSPFTLVMQNDANLVIYDSTGKPTWASNTCCR